MSDAASVALITALSTIAGAGVTGWITLLSHRRQIRHQAVLADKERSETRWDQHRSARKHAYVQFIDQAVRTAHAIGAMVKPDARESEELYLDAAKQAQERLGELWPLLALVNVEGPPRIAELADQVANALMHEGAKASQGHRDPEKKQEFIDASRARWQAQRDFAQAARDVVEVRRPMGEGGSPSRPALPNPTA